MKSRCELDPSPPSFVHIVDEAPELFSDSAGAAALLDKWRRMMSAEKIKDRSQDESTVQYGPLLSLLIPSSWTDG
jgi:hypothetical protein